MPLASVAAQNASLDNDYGTTRGPNAPDAHELALFLGHPLLGGVELSGNGYARADVLPADWDPAVDGTKSATVQFADSTGEWQAVDYYALYDAADGTTLWEVIALADVLEVSSAGNGPLVTFTVIYPTLPTP